jgi:hypothetical protein
MALPNCHNWIKQPKCPSGPGQCGFYIDGTTRHRLNCSFGNATHANPVCPAPKGGCGKGQPGICGAVDACAAISTADATQDVSKLKEGAVFNCSMLGRARNASRYALEYGPILMAATGTWDPLVDCVRLPEGLDVANPGKWLVPTPEVRGGFQVKTSPAFTFIMYMLVQHERFTTFPVIPTSAGRLKTTDETIEKKGFTIDESIAIFGNESASRVHVEPEKKRKSPPFMHGCVNATATSLPYCNTSMSIEERLNDLTARLTLLEKMR